MYLRFSLPFIDVKIAYELMGRPAVCFIQRHTIVVSFGFLFCCQGLLRRAGMRSSCVVTAASMPFYMVGHLIGAIGA